MHLAKIFGALPSMARAYRVREEVYRSELPALKAEVKMTALMMCGSTGIPAFLMARTKGEAAAVWVPERASKSLAELNGTRRPMTRIPR